MKSLKELCQKNNSEYGLMIARVYLPRSLPSLPFLPLTLFALFPFLSPFLLLSFSYLFSDLRTNTAINRTKRERRGGMAEHWSFTMSRRIRGILFISQSLSLSHHPLSFVPLLLLSFSLFFILNVLKGSTRTRGSVERRTEAVAGDPT